ncbi:MAG TPA: glutaredoxin domain-containing protein [Candidatus Saccharibacteria bacterium]|nr:glutaredoxin domain-containing protein [Candidatus Saccharibacteria bacterium]HRK94195.1 glutaredoxin domain-containing protein [Candidatus Saccharibacteria bacterium]
MTDSAAPQVTVYSTTWCAFCATEKQWLDKLGVKYIAKNIEEDEAASRELIEKLNGNFTGVPVTDIAGEMILGFDRPRLQAALEKNKLVPAA